MDFSTTLIYNERCGNCPPIDFLNLINDALILAEVVKGNIVFMNQKALTMYQYSREDMLKLSLADIFHESREALREIMSAAGQYSEGCLFTANHVRKDRSIFKVEVSARYITRPEKTILALIVRNLAVNDKMREEIEVAGKIQRRLLPRDLASDLFRMCSIYKPLNYVSGDLYDVIFEEDNQLLNGIIIDVMGHGLATAFQTSVLKYLFQQATKKALPLNDKLAWINREVIPFFTGGSFAAVLLFALDFKNRTLTYTSGGICHFLFLNRHGLEIEPVSGLFLGLNREEKYDKGTLRFQAGDSFFFITDGLYDLLPQPVAAAMNFDRLQEMFKVLISGSNRRDDASGIGILIR